MIIEREAWRQPPAGHCLEGPGTPARSSHTHRIQGKHARVQVRGQRETGETKIRAGFPMERWGGWGVFGFGLGP